MTLPTILPCSKTWCSIQTRLAEVGEDLTQLKRVLPWLKRGEFGEMLPAKATKERTSCLANWTVGVRRIQSVGGVSMGVCRLRKLGFLGSRKLWSQAMIAADILAVSSCISSLARCWQGQRFTAAWVQRLSLVGHI